MQTPNRIVLAAAMYDTMIELGEKHNLAFERIAPIFAKLQSPEREKWIEWAEAIIKRVS